MEQAVGEGRIRAGGEAQVQVGGGGGCSPAGVGDDEEAPVGALGLEVLHDGGHGFGDVAADQQDGPGPDDVLQGEGEAPVQAQGADACRRCRGHAEAAVVVDVGGVEGDAGELAEEVGLLVGEGAAAEDAHGVGAVVGAGVGEGGGYPVEGVVPGGGG